MVEFADVEVGQGRTASQRADGQGGRDGDLGLNRQAGEAFRREFLSRGDSRDPLVSYRAYRGRDPRIEPLLSRRGLA